MKRFSWILVAALLVALGGCAPTISGNVKFVDRDNQPEQGGNLEGIVVNMINTTSDISSASSSVKTDKNGKFQADSKQLKPGTYKVEIDEPGYYPVSKTIEFKSSSRSIDLDLKKMPMGKSRSYKGMQSDKDKIINPGDVNIQPPSM